MTEILARIRVKERHGIRRFLYPLTATLALPSDVFPFQMAVMNLTTTDGQPIPMQVTLASGREDTPQRLDFAVFLAPFAEQELLLTASGPPLVVDDPLNFGPIETGFRSVQKRFALAIGGKAAGIRDVVYDGISHLRGVACVTQNGMAREKQDGQGLLGDEMLAVWDEDEFAKSRTRIELTACKSWATMTHTQDAPKAGDEIAFTLPLAVKAQTLLCDFGAGGGIYGKLDDKNHEIVWKTNFDADGRVTWTLENGGRIDYAGKAASREEYLSQRWFHVIDDGKALAAAITNVPETCEKLTVTLNVSGDVRVAFVMGMGEETATTCGVCWHFLNDVPAIAAATNPQSILLPPTVEVLPA